MIQLLGPGMIVISRTEFCILCYLAALFIQQLFTHNLRTGA